jgi:hypothetical protein
MPLPVHSCEWQATKTSEVKSIAAYQIFRTG